MDEFDEINQATPCAICESWHESIKFSEHELFEPIRIIPEYTACVQWVQNYLGNGKGTVSICEVHFNKDDIVREYDESGLPHLKLSNDLTIPTFITFSECKINNKIGSYTDFLSNYHNCLNTQPNWNMEATEDEVTFMLKNFEVIIRVKSSMETIVQDGSSTLEQGSILQTHLNNKKIENWSNLRGLMLFCEENSPLTEVMTRLGAIVVLEGIENDSSLQDVLSYVTKILSHDWIFEMCPESNYIVAFQLEPAPLPHITKAIKIYQNFSMTGFVGGQIVGTKKPGTIRFLRKMNKEPVPECHIDENENDEVNWDFDKVDIDNDDHIHSFEHIIEKIIIPPDWRMTHTKNILMLYKSDIRSIPKLKYSIKFNKNLKCSVHIGDSKIDIETLIPSFKETALSFTHLKCIMDILNENERTDILTHETGLEEGEISNLSCNEEIGISDSENFGAKRKYSQTFSDENNKKLSTEIDTTEDSDVEIIPSDDPLRIEPENVTCSNRTFTCLECGEVKATHSALLRHSIKHKTEFICQLCSKKFKNPADLRHHMDLNHVVKDRLICFTCKKSFVVKNDLVAHIIKEHQSKNYYMMSEVKNNTTNPSKSLVCQVCLTTFKHKQSLTRHMRNIHKIENFTIMEDSNEEIMHRANIINQTFELGQTAEQIIINPEDAEEGEIILGGNYESDEMAQHFSEPNNFELIFGNEYQENLNCEEEGEEDLQEFSIQEMPSVDGFWHCSFPLCPYKGKSKKNLMNHSLYHKSNYCCAICSRYYPSKFLLSRHMRTHLGDIAALNEQYTTTFILDTPDEIEIKNEFIQ